MVTCTLNGKEYHIDFVSGRALREIGDAQKAMESLMRAEKAISGGEQIDNAENFIESTVDSMVSWFCVLFNNQFTPQDVLDGYPADKLIHDIAYAIMAVSNQTASVLDKFPIQPEATKQKKARRFRTSFMACISAFFKRAGR